MKENKKINLLTRQTLKYSIVSYAGFILGALASIFLYPYNFAFSGTIRFLLSSAELLMPFLAVGMAPAMVRYFSQLQKEKHTQALFILACIIILVNTLLVLCMYSLWNYFFSPVSTIGEIWKYFYYIVVLAFFISLTKLTTSYISNFNRIVVSNIFENLFPKIAAITAFICFVFLGIEQTSALQIFIAFFAVACIGSIIYLSSLEQIKVQNPKKLYKNKAFVKELFQFSAFSAIGGIGYVASTRIDQIMIFELIDDYSTGLYATLLSIISLIYIPSYGLNAIAAPQVSKYIYEEKYNNLKVLYQKSSESLFLLGSFLFSAILAGSSSLFSIMKNGESLLEIKNVLYFLGIGMLFNIITGINSHIISYSKYHKFNVVLIFVLAFFTIFLNYLFIKTWDLGVIGASISTCISLIIYNIIKTIFIYNKFGIQPFTSKHIKTLVLLLVGIIVVKLLPESTNHWLSLLYKPMIILLLFLIGNEIFNIVNLKGVFSKNWKDQLMGKS